jgi:hypothetical protein
VQGWIRRIATPRATESAILLIAPTCGTGAANSVGDGSEGLDEGVAAGEASA